MVTCRSLRTPVQVVQIALLALLALLGSLLIAPSPASATLFAWPSGWTNPAGGANWEDHGFNQCGYVVVNDQPWAHLGNDSQGYKSGAVRSIGNGVVKRVINQTAPNNGLMVEYQSTAGPFTLLYQHVNPGANLGAAVTAGQQIGTVATWPNNPGNNHVHVSLIPGAYSANTSWYGYRNCSNGDGAGGGHVNPIPWLAANGPAGTTTPPPPDLDGDGVPDQSDMCARFPGPGNTVGCPSEDFDGAGMSDFNGDGRSDVAAFYDYPGNDAAAFVMRGSDTGLNAPGAPVWRPGPGNWELARSRFVSGDFNGDGKSDVAVFYDYPGNDAAAFVMRGSDTGLNAPGAPVWRSGAGNWELARSRLVSGDFDGDGRTDVAAFYDYSGADSAAFIFRGTANGLSAPVSTWRTGPGQWELSRTRLASGDFNGDGKADIAAFYDYSGADSAAFIFRGTANGLSAPVSTWRTGPGQWELSRTRLASGDFNGDGKADIAAFYDYPGADAGAFIFRGTTAGLSAPTSTWRTGTGQWEVGRSRFVGGDFNGDLKADVAVYYDYPGSDAAAFVMTGTESGLTAPGTPVWRSGAGNWELTRTRLVGGGAFVHPAPTPDQPTPATVPLGTTAALPLPSSVLTVPSALPKPKVVVRGRKVVVSWTASLSAVDQVLVDLNKGKDKTVPASSRKVVLKKLKRGRYAVRIAARNVAGASPYSDWARFRVR